MASTSTSGVANPVPRARRAGRFALPASLAFAGIVLTTAGLILIAVVGPAGYGASDDPALARSAAGPDATGSIGAGPPSLRPGFDRD